MAESKQLDKTPDGEAREEGGKSRIRWLVGWVVIPGTLLGALFLSGVHVGANHPQMWLSRLIAWIGS
jgi:hypothetical protein